MGRVSGHMMVSVDVCGVGGSDLSVLSDDNGNKRGVSMSRSGVMSCVGAVA